VSKATTIESEIAPSHSKVVVMFVQSLTILKVFEVSFEFADKSVPKYKSMINYLLVWHRAHITMAYTIRVYQRLPSITAINTNIEIIFFPSGDSERGKWNKIITQTDFYMSNISIYVPRGTWGTLNSLSIKSSSIKPGRVWITIFFVFLLDSVFAKSIIPGIYLK